MLAPEQLRRPGRVDLRPLLQHLTDDRHQRIQLRPRRRPHIPRRRIGRQRPGHGPPVDPQPSRDLPLRDVVLASALISAHSNALATSPGPFSSIPTSSLSPASVATKVAHYSMPRSGALFGARRQASRPSRCRRCAGAPPYRHPGRPVAESATLLLFEHVAEQRLVHCRVAAQRVTHRTTAHGRRAGRANSPSETCPARCRRESRRLEQIASIADESHMSGVRIAKTASRLFRKFCVDHWRCRAQSRRTSEDGATL